MTTPIERFSHAIIVGLAALLAAAVIALIVERNDRGRSFEIAVEGTPAIPGTAQVYITGAVAQPGVYEIADGDRAIDLLNKAGGAAPDADLEAMNLATRLHDEDRVVVPRVGQAAVSGATPQVAGAVSAAAVNINTASAQELDALPGIGPVYSQRIVDSRTTAGPFATADELVSRAVIPRATYEKIRDLITVGP